MSNVQESVATIRTSTNERFDASGARLKSIEKEYESVRERLSTIDMLKESLLSQVNDRNRLDELTDFYRHLNGVIETIIDKFSDMERTMNKIIK